MGAALALVLAFGLTAMAASELRNWPEARDFERWATKIVQSYSDPAVKCNKVTAIDSPLPGAIRVMGIWCAEAAGVGSPGMVVAVKWVGRNVDGSFREDFPTFRGRIAISLWDRDGSVLLGAKDW